MQRFSIAACFTMLVMAMFSCNNDERFHEEMYKSVFSLVCDNDNVYSAVHSFENEISEGFVSVYCGGTNPIKEDVVIELEYDTDIINKYNYRYYDLDTPRYSKVLDASRFDMSGFTATMKAGQADPYVTFPLKIHTAGISPDSVYFIPLKIKSLSREYDINPNKVSVMYRPFVENKYAQTKVNTTYSSRGEKSGMEIVSTKRMYPLTATQSRVTVDTQTGLTDNITNLELIRRYAIILTVGADNLVTLSPYGTIQVEALGTPDENRYEISDFNRFYLHYRYRTLTTPATETSAAVYSAWVEITELLKRQN
jgi:hypothetical protein